MPSTHQHQPDPQVLHDFEPRVVFDLEPVDSVTPQQAWLGGRWQPDPLVLDDQAFIVDIKNKGLVVITGCGHAGVVPAHCTGWRAQHAMGRRFGEAFIPNTVGTRFGL